MNKTISTLFFTLILLNTGCVVGEGAYNIKRAGVFNVGGELVDVYGANIDGSGEGTVWAKQLLVSYFIPDTDSPKVPVLMIPGFGVAKDVYLETPDGREGWAMNFVRMGHPVYLIEPANSVRAGINPEQINGLIDGRTNESAKLFTWSRELGWPRFGFGREFPVPFEDSKLPAGSYDALTTMFTSVLVKATRGPAMLGEVQEFNIKGINEVIEKTGPAVLMVHSAAGVPGFMYAQKYPEKVKAVINIEPVGCPADSINEFPDVPVLSMFADHMEVRPQMPARQVQCQQVIDALNQRGVQANMLALPDMGIRGNSHFPMSESNSFELALAMLIWIGELE